MITRFKIFENKKKNYTDEDDLAELFSQEEIEKFFDDYYEVGEEDAARMLNLWDYVDIDAVRANLIEELAEGYRINNKKFNKTDLIQYIRDNMKNIDKNIDELINMSKKQLVEIIEEEGEESEFVLNYFKEEFDDVHPEVIMSEIYGEQAIEEPGSLMYYLREYLDKDELIKDARDRIDFEYKYEYLRDYISSDEGLQNRLLELDPNTIECLFDVMDSERSIGNTYEFQKKYIEFRIKKDDEDVLPEVIKNIHDKFGLDSDIEDEYKDYTYLISAEKYNL